MRTVGVWVVLATTIGCSNVTSPEPQAIGGMTQGGGRISGTVGADGGQSTGGMTQSSAGTTAAGGMIGNAGSGGAAGTSGEGGAEFGGAGSGDASGVDGAGDAGGPVQPIVKIMSFNIRYSTDADGDNAWAIRKPLAYDVFTRQAADLVGVQEALDAQLVDIDGAVAGYLRIGVGRNDGAESGEYSAIYYRSERFAVDSSGTFWFSDTPEVPGSTSWGNDIPRICTWGHFTDTATGYGLYLFNLHLDHQSQPSREKSVALLMKRAAERPIATDPVIVTGDFNADEENLAIAFMKGEAMIDGVSNPLPMIDSFRALYPNETQVRTGHSFNGGTDGSKIDYVFMGQGQLALAAEIDRTIVEGRYPSDHYPVTATLQLPAQP